LLFDTFSCLCVDVLLCRVDVWFVVQLLFVLAAVWLYHLQVTP
jgi:hypothetical protein